ncbi:MAG: hypothetical protein COY80_00840 [Candidatus Pacebacteria bacterium CG_4_10_14_0_8_um_filter_42_14]|nr:MAG: hypothetical protein COY80_00840 [Candidatus Pacebacteria bacterium CG_4_10_14_0_8_um_filter_42_14]
MRPLTPQDKKQIYHYLAEAYMNLLKDGKLGKFERKVISKRILDSMRKAEVFNDIITLVDGLAKNYDFFDSAATQIKAQLSSFHEQKVIQNLEQYFTTLSKHV